MKTNSLLSICLICSIIFLFSCGGSSPVEPDLPEIPELPTPEINADTVEVSVKSAIHIDSDPLSTRASNDDLYALQVIQQIPAKNELGYEFTEDLVTVACHVKNIVCLSRREQGKNHLFALSEELLFFKQSIDKNNDSNNGAQGI